MGGGRDGRSGRAWDIGAVRGSGERSLWLSEAETSSVLLTVWASASSGGSAAGELRRLAESHAGAAARGDRAALRGRKSAMRGAPLQGRFVERCRNWECGSPSRWGLSTNRTFSGHPVRGTRVFQTAIEGPAGAAELARRFCLAVVVVSRMIERRVCSRPHWTDGRGPSAVTRD